MLWKKDLASPVSEMLSTLIMVLIMKLRFLFKYFLSLVLVANSSFSLALSEDCIKNIDLINNLDSSEMFNDNTQHCHGASESESTHHKISIHDSEECLECEYCSMNNQVTHLNLNSELNFSLLIQ